MIQKTNNTKQLSVLSKKLKKKRKRARRTKNKPEVNCTEYPKHKYLIFKYDEANAIAQYVISQPKYNLYYHWNKQLSSLYFMITCAKENKYFGIRFSDHAIPYRYDNYQNVLCHKTQFGMVHVDFYFDVLTREKKPITVDYVLCNLEGYFQDYE